MTTATTTTLPRLARPHPRRAADGFTVSLDLDFGLDLARLPGLLLAGSLGGVIVTVLFVLLHA